MVVTEEHSDASHTGILLMGKELWTIFLSIHFHAAELVNIEWSSESADALLLEDSRTSIFLLHCNVAYQK